MDVERLKEAIHQVEANYVSGRLNLGTGVRAVIDAARDHLGCGTVTDEMVEAARDTASAVISFDNLGDDEVWSLVYDMLEAAFRVETGEQE